MVTAFGYGATYGYETTTGRKSTLTYNGAGLTGGWHMDALGRLDTITWTVGSTLLSKHAYGFDAMNRRTTAQRETGETWRYGYNERGEVNGAVKRTTSAEDAPAKRGLQYGYGYDLIGNRIMDSQHTPDSGTGLDQVAWAANNLNQITGRGHHASQWVFGHAKAAAQLSIAGGGTVIREGDEFTVPVSRAGAATTADWHSLDVSATLAGAGRVENGTALDVTTLRQGKVWFASSPENLAYDEDGNLTQDGRWTYTWDAENRLLSATTRTDVAAATSMTLMHLDFAYDALGRRIRKAVYQFETAGQGPATWHLKNDLRFLYDGWNLVAEIEAAPATPASSSPRLVRSYAWGTDLSGRLQRAGGVGGLLLVQSAGNEVEAPCYDGNGNISTYVRGATGVVNSRHDYDAFGRPIWNELEGTARKQQAASAFGFSTKYTDVETNLCYYGKRYYVPDSGRWLSRDPIGENGGINLYNFVLNAPLNDTDYLGLDIIGCGEMDSYLQSHGITQYMKYKIQDRDAYKYWSLRGSGGGTLHSEILMRMIGSMREYEVVRGSIENLDKYVKARVRIVESAKKLANSLGWYGDKGKETVPVNSRDFPIPNNPRTAADVEKYVNDIIQDPEKYAAECYRAAWLAVRSSGQEIAENSSDDKGDWVPGDWGYVTNTTHDKVNPAQQGENIIYLGSGQFWGHTGKGTIATGNEIWTKVNGWPKKGGASLDAQRTEPAGPLVRVTRGIGQTATPVPNTDKMISR